MNGEVSDTMDEPMDTSPPTTVGTKNHSGAKATECELTNCGNSNGTNDIETDDGEESSEEDCQETTVNDNSNGTNNVNSTVPLSKNNDEIPQDNQCSDSNESYEDSRARPPVTDKIEVQRATVPKDSEPSETIDDPNTATKTQNNMCATVETDQNDDVSEEDIDSEPEIHEVSDELNDSDIILIENSPLKQNGNKPADTKECQRDEDSNVTKTDNKKPNTEKIPDEKPVLRRSSRSIKRLSYKDGNISNGDNSDLEIIAVDDTISKNKPIVINDSKKLFDMAAKHKPNSNRADQTQLVIIDSNSRKEGHVGKMNSKAAMNAMTAQNVYQSIVARGTTVTPVPARVPAPAPPSILPSLTDDMLVVEAPSFIVPYVYEKPSVTPFREFVDILGKQLDEENAKEQKLLLKKEKERKAKKEQERRERKDRGEEVSESEEETEDSGAEAAKKRRLNEKAEKKARRQRKHEEDDDSWNGESSTESEDIPSDEDITDSKQKDANLAKLEGVISSLASEKANEKSDNYFDCSLGKFFIDVGSSLVQEYVQTDLLKQQQRKLHREKKSGHNTRETQTAIASLMKNLEFSKENNASFRFRQKKCEFCSFKTESSLVISNHLEIPHMKNNLYHCNLCEFNVRSSGEILVHMEKVHGKRGRLERAPAYHPCASCPFEDNGKGKLARHLVSCAKRFRPEVNLAPPIDWEPPAKLPKMIKMKNASFPHNFKNINMGANMSRQMMNMGVQSGMSMNMGTRPRQRNPVPQVKPGLPPRGAPARHNLPTPVLIPNYTGAQNKNTGGKSQPSISITPLPSAPQPVPQTSQQQQGKGSFVICEICDGYIKDLEQLRNHMQWIHKVKIHPKMIYNRPPLNCQKCQFRFFTDQGLERHLLGSHGLVTSSMQEASNKGKDAGRCPVCGRVYQWKLLNHVARDHNMTLKPAHLSYKCTVCTATFGMYKQFENHVYSAHRVVAKRVMDKNKVTPPAAKPDPLLKPLKINDEITIIPQPSKSNATTSKGK